MSPPPPICNIKFFDILNLTIVLRGSISLILTYLEKVLQRMVWKYTPVSYPTVSLSRWLRGRAKVSIQLQYKFFFCPESVKIEIHFSGICRRKKKKEHESVNKNDPHIFFGLSRKFVTVHYELLLMDWLWTNFFPFFYQLFFFKLILTPPTGVTPFSFWPQGSALSLT